MDLGKRKPQLSRPPPQKKCVLFLFWSSVPRVSSHFLPNVYNSFLKLHPASILIYAFSSVILPLYLVRLLETYWFGARLRKWFLLLLFFFLFLLLKWFSKLLIEGWSCRWKVLFDLPVWETLTPQLGPLPSASAATLLIFLVICNIMSQYVQHFRKLEVADLWQKAIKAY